jgi:hypothetical protein
MYTARIVVLTTAPGAGGIAAYLARGFDAKSLQTEPIVQLHTADVLIGLGRPQPRATILSAATNGPKPPINLRCGKKASTSFATASNAP